MIVSSLMILAMIGYAVAVATPQQPTPDKMVEDRPAIAQEQAAPAPVVQPPAQEQPKPVEQAKAEPEGEIYTVTAYDLSVQSCGKAIGHPGYGKTATGYSLKGHSWDTARSIAVDPRFIPLGSKVLIKFLDERFHKYNGVYTARDTGGAIKGHKIDFFLGDFEDNRASDQTMAFGKRQAEVIVLEA